ncbi:MAG: hydantoinase/oxoprolinase family protein, partial [Chloroflexi bacterium]|nr:hydantoinase/oxoprolinase family protein [Chloroflexota bacterium]
RKLGAPRVIVPPNAGVGSALGFFTAPRAFDLVRSHKVALHDDYFDEIEALFHKMEAEGERTLRQAGATGDILFERSIDARFVGQGAETNLPVAERMFTALTSAELRRRFDEVYEQLYGRTYPESLVELINFRVRASLPVRLLQLPRLKTRTHDLGVARKGTRLAYSGVAHEFVPFTVYDRYKLFPGATFAGPAIVEERESTVVVGEDATVSVDEYGFLWIHIGIKDGEFA